MPFMNLKLSREIRLGCAWHDRCFCAAAMRRTLTAFVFLILAQPASARAQVPPPAPRPVPNSPPPPEVAPALPGSPRPMALGDAIAFARAHQPAVLAGIARVVAQQEAANIPRAQWQPLVGLNAQILGSTANNTTATYVTPDYMDIPRIGATRAVSSVNATWQPYASTLVAAGIVQEGFDFGRIAAQTAAADAMVEVQRQSSATALLDVTYGVVEAYFAVEAAKAIRKAADDAYTRSKVHRDLAKSGVSSGMRPPIDLTRAEADLARFDAGRIRAQGGVDTAQAVYAAAVGVPDAALDVSGAAPAAPDLPALNDAIAQAGARDPRILGAIAQLRTQESQTKAIAALTRPDISLTGTISGRAGGAPPSSGSAAEDAGWLPNVPNWDVGAIFSWPLFDPVVRAREEASHSEEQVRREELGLARFNEVAAIREAYVAVVVARQALPALQQSLDAARANWAQADARFRAGLGTAVELADAEAVLADAEIQLALGVFDVARTRAVFGRAIAEAV
jgi:outer membrane protein